MSKSAIGRLGDRFQSWNRSRKADWITKFMADNDLRTVLLVGVVPRDHTGWENIVESSIEKRADWVVWSGLSLDGEVAESVRYVAGNGLQLPFHDDAFDLVVSNAVIEHVGGLPEQVQFVAEHQRVGRHWVITTPNRWFPIESHTRVVLKHYSPKWRAPRREFTRLLSKREFADLVGKPVVGVAVGPTFIGYR